MTKTNLTTEDMCLLLYQIQSEEKDLDNLIIDMILDEKVQAQFLVYLQKSYSNPYFFH